VSEFGEGASGAPAAAGDTTSTEVSVLHQAPLFAALDSDAAASLDAIVRHERYQRGELVFAEGDAGESLYVVIDGKVRVFRSASDGRENMLAVLGPGEMFGELSLFDPGPRTASVGALTDCTLASLAHAALRPLLYDRPRVGEQLLQALAQRLRRTNEAMADLVFSDVPGRVAKALIDLADRFGNPEGDAIRVTHDLTQEELAQLVGASRETVNKALSEFASRGWLRVDGRSVLLIEPERLANRAR
jgi:CRP/FNR family cyclic AMP-dependent transcriptional regulator